ncbi:hypothetical protein E3P99_01500 [Wallemia hederae]|uniref:HSF-type DNA-binding domain-containing protein n=1 Tax=Wallemia hederae TaxID=1540922 RepID=A0A4T0FPE5_9BASI|nr:hypothetical protein E3P99_01500 [Wallemia hederae]
MPAERNIARALKIPPFINKLYSIVNDSDTDEYIHWSESGDTFFVPNPELLARQVLPRYFKHSNYSSFVRQLNMYGFNKVPHLHQGVLNDSGSAELWEFTNENFQRDKPDLLVDVHRKVSNDKKGGGSGGKDKESGGKEGRDRDSKGKWISEGSPENHQQLTNYIDPSSSKNSKDSAQIDVGTVIAGFTQIQKQQAYISSSLLTLQQSNQRLWQEAAAARERHRQHEETIKKLLQFVSSVYGGDVGANAPNAAASASTSTSFNAPAFEQSDPDSAAGKQMALVPKKRQLMLNHGDYDGGPDFKEYKEYNDLNPYNHDEDISRFTHISPESQSSVTATNTPASGSEYVESVASAPQNSGSSSRNKQSQSTGQSGQQSTQSSHQNQETSNNTTNNSNNPPTLTLPDLSHPGTFDSSKSLISPNQLDLSQFASLLSPNTTQRLIGGGGLGGATDYLNYNGNGDSNGSGNGSSSNQTNDNQIGTQRSQLNELSYDLDALQQSINNVVNNMGLNPSQASEILQASQSPNDHQAMADLFKGYDADLETLLRGLGDKHHDDSKQSSSPPPFNFVEEADDQPSQKKQRQ